MEFTRGEIKFAPFLFVILSGVEGWAPARKAEMPWNCMEAFCFAATGLSAAIFLQWKTWKQKGFSLQSLAQMAEKIAAACKRSAPLGP